MGALVLDSSVVIALFDTKDVHHEQAAAEVRRWRAAGGSFVLPATVVSEVLVGAHRQSTETVTHRRQQLRDTFGPIRVVDEDVAVTAARLRASHGSLRLPDALILAVAMVDGAERILTADKRWAAVDQRVTVI
ncbi:MAG TPA: PIN domain-containing protein [Mycobacteriales bacterium]|nr:PIN domain-containing protein [Mycobacteriales bacterium]